MAVVVSALLATGGPASAHQDPAGCFETSAPTALSAFRDAGATIPIGGSGPVDVGDTIFYQARLFAGGSTVCAFQGGTITIITPDGSPHDVTPGGGVPCVGGSVAPCTGLSEQKSNVQSYTVTTADGVAGSIVAGVDYAGGQAHSNAGDTDIATGTATRSFTVVHPDVLVQKAPTQATINAGDQAQFTITVTNGGSGNANNVTLTDTVPGSVAAPGWTVGGADAAACAPNPVGGGGTLTCTFGTLAPGETRTFTLTATSTTDNCPSIVNAATVSATNELTGEQGNDSTGPVTIAVTCPDVTVVKSTSTPTINAGESASYSITVTNNGPGSAFNVILTDTLPSGLSWTVGGPDAAACSPANPVAGGSVLTCNFGTVLFPGARSITLTATTSASSCPAIDNTATVSDSGDTNTGDNSSGPIHITVNCPGVQVTTTPDPSAGTLNVTTLNDSATLVGGANPTGTITFNLFDPDQAGCVGTPRFQQSVPVSGGSASTSGGFVPDKVGTWQWTADYSGDANNSSASSGCGAEAVTINKATPTISTTPNPATGDVGVTALNDSATLTGGSSPTGTITFDLFDPDQPGCIGTPVFSLTVPVSGGGASTTGGPVANKAGTWHWRASYSGDTNNNPATSLCFAEPVTIGVPGVPTLTTTPIPSVALPGTPLNDSATLTGAVAPTGTITFNLFAPNDPTCAGRPVFTQTVPVQGNGTYSTSGGPPADAEGVWQWTAIYSGDATNAPASSGCAREPVLVGAAVPTLSEWGMLLLLVLLVGGGCLMMSRGRNNMTAA